MPLTWLCSILAWAPSLRQMDSWKDGGINFRNRIDMALKPELFPVQNSRMWADRFASLMLLVSSSNGAWPPCSLHLFSWMSHFFCICSQVLCFHIVLGTWTVNSSGNRLPKKLGFMKPISIWGFSYRIHSDMPRVSNVFRYFAEQRQY